MRVGTDVHGPDLVAAVDQVGRWEDLGPLQGLIDIDHKYGPAIVFELQGYLRHKSIGHVEVLEQIADREADAVGPLSHAQVNVVAEGQAVARALDLKVDVPPRQAQSLEGSCGMRHLDEVVGRDRPLDPNGPSANFLCLC